MHVRFLHFWVSLVPRPVTFFRLHEGKSSYMWVVLQKMAWAWECGYMYFWEKFGLGNRVRLIFLCEMPTSSTTGLTIQYRSGPTGKCY